MKTKLFLLFLTFQVLGISVSAQNPAKSTKLSRLDMIYRNLEYNTTAFDDIKNTWNVTDPVYVREIYNRFIVKNALTIDGQKPSLELLEEKTRDIYNGDVFIELKKRYYDDEIEELRFFTESKLALRDTTRLPRIKKDYFFDQIDDNIYIKNVLGDKIYENLKEQFYAHTDLTKEIFENKLAYAFDIYLHLLEPELLVWSPTTAEKNKYLVSIIGRWGNDQIVLPGWFYPDYFLGLKLAYVDYIKNNEPYNTYLIELGIGIPARQPTFEFDKDEFGQRLFHSGTNFFFRLGGNPLKLISPDLIDFEFKLDGAFSITEYKTNDFKVNYMSKFFSNRNYITFFVKYKDIFNVMDFGWFYAGLGLSTYDITHYLLDPEVTTLQEIQSPSGGNFKTLIMAEGGISNYSGLLRHNLATILSYNFSEGIGYAGLKTYFMLSNSFGIDFRFYTAFGKPKDSLPFYRLDHYIVFSPIFRINY